MHKPSAPRGDDWLLGVRRRAHERFAALGLPTTRSEEWRHAALAPHEKRLTNPAHHEVAAIPRAELDRRFGTGPRLVFLGGAFDVTGSNVPPGLSLAPILQELPSLEGLLGSIADRADDGVAALNVAYFTDGACLKVDRGRALESPIHLVFVGPSVVRNLIVLSGNAQAEVIETHINEGASVSNVFTELVLGMGANLRYTRVVDAGPEAVILGKVEVLHGRDSKLFGTLGSFGGKLSRTGLHARLDNGSELDLGAFYQASGAESADLLTHLDHAGSQGISRQICKGVIDGHGTGTFYGKVRVEAGTEKNDAKQQSRSLLLSADATANTRPQLEIDAEDVACSHGATIGRIDEDQIFYLVSRGIDELEARRILTGAFAAEVLDRVSDPVSRAWLGEVWARHGGGR
ncbi:MAG: SufD family Fe-S cluster assembly protein [Myxococcota bacterium]